MANRSIGVSGELVQRLFADPDRLQKLVEVICQAAMAEEVSAHVGAVAHERSEGRRGHRNGCKPRALRTRVGELELSVPQSDDMRGLVRSTMEAAFADIGSQQRKQSQALAKRQSELKGMQERLLNGYLAGTIDEAVFAAKWRS